MKHSFPHFITVYEEVRKMMKLPINEIIQGDCLEVIETFPNLSIDCLIVDPPYSSGARQDSSKTSRGKMLRGDKHDWFSHDNMSTTGFSWFMRHFLVILKPKMKPNAVGYMFSDWRQYPTISQIIESTGFRLNNLVVWDKMHFGMGGFYRNQHEFISFFSNGASPKPQFRNLANIIKAKNIHVNERVHPTQKPFELLKPLIEISTKKGDVILDPMCGSGATCVVAKQLRRNYVGIDISPEYVEIAKKQILKYGTPLTQFSEFNENHEEGKC